MARPDDTLLTELQIRQALSWQDEKAACEADLKVFLRCAWPYFDSSIYISNWHTDSIADHLMAVSRGQIKRLLINQPPRTGKTNLVSIAWPVWTWIVPPDARYPLLGPGTRFLCASYGANKAEADGVTARRLIGTQWFKERWGERVAICFPADQTIQTETGPMAIGEIVERRLPLRVLSWSEQAQRIELRPIVGWHRNPSAAIYRLTFDNGTVVRCTGDHRIRILGGHWLPACQIPIGTYTLAIRGDQACGAPAPGTSCLDLPDGSLRDAIAGGQNILQFSTEVDRPRDIGGNTRALVGAVFQRVSHVFRARAIAQIVFTAVGAVAIQMAHLLAIGRFAYEGSGNQSVDLHPNGLATTPQVEMRIAMAVQRGIQHLFLGDTPDHTERKFSEHHLRQRFDAPVAGDHVAREVRQTDPDFTRLIAITHDGYAPQTYCLSVAGNQNFIAGGDLGIIVSNCRDRDNQGQYDTTAGGYRISTGIPESLGKGGAVRILDDPSKTDDVESDLVRNATLRSYDEVWRTRSNDPVQGVEVIVMQRLNENDVSGHILAEEDPNLVHLMLPLEYDPRRHCHTSLPFDDPRKVDGELLWPERLPRAWVDRQRKLVGPHAFAGQYNQTPVARGGGIILREWWTVWPPEGEEASWTRHIEDNGRMRQVMLYPDLEYVLVSCDTAYGDKEESDWSACTTWGVFRTPGDNPAIILLEAWRERLPLKPLVEKILNTARKRQADAVLVEARASGLSVLQEIRRLARDGEFTLFADVPRGDKVARLHAVSAAFSGGLIYAPVRRWSEMVIDEVSSFPRSRWKDLTDSVSAAIKKLRDLGVLQHPAEAEAERVERLVWHGQQHSVREEYGV